MGVAGLPGLCQSCGAQATLTDLAAGQISLLLLCPSGAKGWDSRRQLCFAYVSWYSIIWYIMVYNSFSCYIYYNCHQYRVTLLILFSDFSALPDFAISPWLFLSLCLKYLNLPLIFKVAKVFSFVSIFGTDNIIEFYFYYNMNIMSFIRKFKPFSSVDFILTKITMAVSLEAVNKYVSNGWTISDIQVSLVSLLSV